LKHLGYAAWLVGIALGSGQTPESPARGPAIVYLADGTSFPLRTWSFSYEYVMWQAGSPQALGTPSRTESADLWMGKRIVSPAGGTLEIEYSSVDREREQDGVVRKVSLPVAKELRLRTGDGKKMTLRPEAPHRDLLAPSANKVLVVQARSLDLRGETLTGTKRDFCILSYSSLVECVDAPGQQVVKIEFQR